MSLVGGLSHLKSIRGVVTLCLQFDDAMALCSFSFCGAMYFSSPKNSVSMKVLFSFPVPQKTCPIYILGANIQVLFSLQKIL